MSEVASAFVSLVPSARGWSGKINSQIGGDVDRAGRTSGSRFGKLFFSSSMKPLRAFGAAAVGLFAVDKVKDFFESAIDEARESQKVSALTAQVIKTTGGAANISAKQIGNLATAISNKTGIDDEAVQSASNYLLTFTAVRNEVGKGNKVFNQATKLAVDMSAALGGDAKSAALQLGKALNDPEKGVTKLARSGVSFTEQQVKQIKAMQESGNVLGAQKLILGEVSKEFGGAAAASATSGEKMSVAWGNLKEQIGTAVLPALDKAEQVITSKVIPAVSGFITQLQNGKGVGGAVAGIFGRLQSVFFALRPVISAVAAYFQQLVPKLVQIAQQVGVRLQPVLQQLGTTFRSQVLPALRQIIPPAIKFAGTVATVGAAILGKVLPPAIKFAGFLISRLAPAISAQFSFFSRLVHIIGTVAGAFIAAISGVARFVSAIRSKVGSAVSFVASIPGKVKSALGDVGSLLISSGKALIEGFARGIEDAASSAYDAAKGVVGKVRNLFPFSPAKEGPFSGKGYTTHSGSKLIQDFAVGIGKGGLKAALATRQVLAKVARETQGAKLKKQLASIMDLIGDGLSGKGKKGAANVQKVKDSLGKLTDAIKKQLDKQLQAAKDKVSKIADTISSLKDTIKQTASSVAQNYLPDFTTNALFGPDGKMIKGTAVSSFKSQLSSQKTMLDQVTAAYAKLKSEGLNGNWLSSLLQSGNNNLILDLAAGSKSSALSAQSMYQQVQSEANALGSAVANNTTSKAQLDAATKQLAVAQRQEAAAQRREVALKSIDHKLDKLDKLKKLDTLDTDITRGLNRLISAANNGRRS